MEKLNQYTMAESRDTSYDNKENDVKIEESSMQCHNHRHYHTIMSACLAGVSCRYNKVKKSHTLCEQLYADGGVILVCPEVMGGLGIPRMPSELIGSRVINKAGEDVSDAFALGAKQVLTIAKGFGISRAILKENSPSCGSTMIYDGSFTGKKIIGQGICAKLLSDHGIDVVSEHTIKPSDDGQ